ncbi:MAG: dihydrodipicolinate synthase family protein [Acidobacteria bacterium]|nr:dihydrodipicolinate synthase family protein [Acidobacteriota bacterium]
MKTLAEIMGRVSVPLVTPFHQNGDVNYDALAQLVDFVITRKYCNSIIATGTTGEFYSLTDEERLEVWRTIQKANQGRVPLVAPSQRRRASGATSKRWLPQRTCRC